jgi:hypothetical protein
MLPLSLSYDHRAIDGADGARFCAGSPSSSSPSYSRFRDDCRSSHHQARRTGGQCGNVRAADLGLKTALVDPELNPGGVCVYRGCIPSKALLHVAKLVTEARHASAWGITFAEPTIDLDKLRAF